MGFWLTGTGYHPLKKRIKSILAILPPKNVKSVRAFVGLVNFIKNHIPGCAKTLELITKLTKKETPFIWGEGPQKAFDKIKADMAELIMLSCPNLNEHHYVTKHLATTSLVFIWRIAC